MFEKTELYKLIDTIKTSNGNFHCSFFENNISSI
ncbi:hypothetical protein BN1195_00899 [Chryseobacterium oranimense G311]|nr:hypothetical protein BN1195_00899 [Chryseobacterium oranimense G311]